MMKWIAQLLISLPLLAYAGGDYGQAWEYHFQGSNSYTVVFTTQIRAYLELRTYEGKVLESLDFYSPHREPDFDVKDVVGDDKLELLIRTAAGGTGIGRTSLSIFMIADGHFQQVGRFVLDETAASWPETNWCHTVKSTVSFPKKDQVSYRSMEVETKDGITRTNTVAETFEFDSATLTLRKTKEKPQPTSAGDVATRAAPEK